MSSKNDVWFRIGHAVERARHARPGGGGDVVERDEEDGDERSGLPAIPSSDDLLAAGLTLAVDRLLGAIGKRARPGFGRMIRAGLAGGAAALLVDLVRPLIRNDPGLPTLDRRTVDRVVAGIGQGLVYGVVVEPRVPGHALMKGALYGSVEYAVDPMGGISGLLGGHAPQARIPLIGEILADLEPDDRAYFEHVVFGIALALLYESSPSSNGIRPDKG